MGNPTTTPLYEKWHDGGFLVSEANGHRSRDKIVIAQSAPVPAGAVLGKQTVGSSAAAAAQGVNTGNGTFGPITLAAGVVAGAYVVAFDSATTFNVDTPTGQRVGHGATGVNFAGGGLAFKITAGATAFVAGDAFSVTVAAGSGKWLQSKSSAIDGSQVPAGLLFGAVDATVGDKSATGVTRDCEVNGSELIWDVSYSPDQISAGIATLAQSGIVTR